jgi:D-aminopeptidase
MALSVPVRLVPGTDTDAEPTAATPTVRAVPSLTAPSAAAQSWRDRRAQRRALRQAATQASQSARADRRARVVAIATLAARTG